MSLSDAGYYLKTSLLLLSNTIKYYRHFMLELKPEKNAKNFCNFQLKKMESIYKDILHKTSPEVAKIIDDELINNWETLSVQNVLGMMVQMDDEQRRQVEEFAESILSPKTKQT